MPPITSAPSRAAASSLSAVPGQDTTPETIHYLDGLGGEGLIVNLIRYPS
jgi:hypothetical protein